MIKQWHILTTFFPFLSLFFYILFFIFFFFLINVVTTRRSKRCVRTWSEQVHHQPRRWSSPLLWVEELPPACRPLSPTSRLTTSPPLLSFPLLPLVMKIVILYMFSHHNKTMVFDLLLDLSHQVQIRCNMMKFVSRQFLMTKAKLQKNPQITIYTKWLNQKTLQIRPWWRRIGRWWRCRRHIWWSSCEAHSLSGGDRLWKVWEGEERGGRGEREERKRRGRGESDLGEYLWSQTCQDQSSTLSGNCCS